MATVYKAYDTRLETDVAVKVIRTETLPQNAVERALKRFEREAKALAKLTHPNIVKVTDYGEFEGKPYLVMEYLPSGTLKEKLGKSIPWQEAVRLLIPIARALGYAHQHGMIHRDVKPSNILITDSGDPLLTDFGVAKIIDQEATMDLTGTNAAVGTPEYMAPEQVTSKSVDQRADIYALGVVFYEMVTGRKLYTADTPMAVLFKHASEPLPRPSRFVPNLPQPVENILLKALAKNPKDRYQDMQVFALALQNLLLKREGRPSVKVTFQKPKTRSHSRTRPVHAQRGSGAHWNRRGLWFAVGSLVFLIVLGLISLNGANLKNQTFFPVALSASSTPIPTNTSTLTPVPTSTLLPTPDIRIKARVTGNCKPNICVYDGLNNLVEEIKSTPKTLAIDYYELPSWSPDGNQLVFSANENVFDTTNGNALFIYNLQDESFRKLTSSSYSSSAPTWSPDGKYIAYSQECIGMLFSLDTNVSRSIGSGYGYTRCVGKLRWSPDSRYLALLASNDLTHQDVGIVIIDTKTGKSTYVSYNFSINYENVQEMAWNPSGTELIIWTAHLNYFVMNTGCFDSGCSANDIRLDPNRIILESWLPNYYPQWQTN